MKQPVVRSFLGAVLVGMSAFGSLAETYYWAGGDSWNLYSNPDNWRSGSADGDVAPSCPGAADSLGKLPWKNMLFDLGGGEESLVHGIRLRIGMRPIFPSPTER